jgi:D-amino-acid dehydrogenase
MRVAVLGAGVVGVTTAYELARDGHQVTVIDRLPEAAAESSFANAGLIAPGHAYTWSSPRAPCILLRSLFDDSQALRFRPSLDPRLWSWSWKFLMNCTAEKTRSNTKRKVQLCLYSQERLKALISETGVDYHAVEGGLLYLYRKPESFARGSANTRILTEEGLELRAMDANEAARIEPALEPVREKLAGAIYCPSDASGDARVFTQNLARFCVDQLGVRFIFNTAIVDFEGSGSRITSVKTSDGVIRADEFVLCLGVFAPDFARKLGVNLPVYPIKGYSVTIPIDGRNTPPSIGGVDEDNLVAYARFGDRLRVTATAEFSGFDKSHKPADFRHMLGAIQDIFPNGADYTKPQYWAGLRPMTPEGTPIFGHGGHYTNMIFNVGHGHMGWTMSAGSARITADILNRTQPDFDPTGMLVEQSRSLFANLQHAFH